VHIRYSSDGDEALLRERLEDEHDLLRFLEGIGLDPVTQ
jgi:hypothetical protein